MSSNVSVRVTGPVEGVPGTVLYEAVEGDGPTGARVVGPRVALVGLMHGNEPVGARVLDHLAEVVDGELVAGSILAVHANLDAAAVDRRHTPDGTDLNRLWDRATLRRLAAREPSSLCSEERRALELAPLLVTCDAVLDLHSTSRPSAPFVLFRDDQRHAGLARRLGVQHLVTGMHENGIVSGGLCSNVGLDMGERSSRLGFTFEAGQHTDPGNSERAWVVVWRLLHALNLWRSEPPATEVSGEVFEVLERFVQAPAASEPFRFVGYQGGPVGSGRRGPLRQLHSFEEVHADEVIVRRGRNVVVRAQTPFTMLMPAPDTDPGTDLYYVAQPRHGGLGAGTLRTDGEARREAAAIERMLDLVDDDDFMRGCTWVSFDARQVLDRCADVVGRTLRLPPGHPHRRITIVGRGDVGEEEAERRAGQRYRHAMRQAIAAGLPVNRVQLLRGAPLAWLDSLTSHGMLELLRQRERTHGEHVGGVRLLLSVQQPHTVSLLVAGDLERAIATGDTRHVRVGVLIEAATAEPDGARPKVRVVRLGLISARMEILTAAQKLLGSLWQEHRDLVWHGGLAADPRVTSLLLDTGEIEARPDPETLGELRSALYRLQLRLWCDTLNHEGLVAEHLPDSEARGRWMAATMAATGILDPSAIENLLIEPDGEGWTVEPERVRSLSAALERQAGSAFDADFVLPAMRAPRMRPLPRQPMLASHVDADDLERWFGWKRWVRSGQTIPGTRGKDLDLALVDTEVRDRLVRWYTHARGRAAANPGDVLVVVAGDGSNPHRDDWELLRAHRALLLDPNLHYLRIQHAAGTHLAWMKDFVGAVAARPDGMGTVSLQWEAEHGATVSVVLVATRHAETDASGGEAAAAGQGSLVERPWSLDGWAIDRCAVVLSDLQHSGGRDYKVALITEPMGQDGPNPELVHFGREHCEGLLKQARWRVRGERGAPPPGAIDACVTDQLARWIERARTWRRTSSTIPAADPDRVRWMARRLGIADERLARALVIEMEGAVPVTAAARALWEAVPPWPGPLWHQPHELD